MSFKAIRITLLLTALMVIAVASNQQSVNAHKWYDPLTVTLIPINTDGGSETDAYIQALTLRRFDAVNRFLSREAKRYDIIASPIIKLNLAKPIHTLPPDRPDTGVAILDSIVWSLQLRYWAWQNTPDSHGDDTGVLMFLLYRDLNSSKALQHSLGLQKGLIGIINAYAHPQQSTQNNVVIAHELLHTLGAKDKYNENGLPAYPEGYANPELTPRHPQAEAEIMGGRIALSANDAVVPERLGRCLIGPQTATEIGWIK